MRYSLILLTVVIHFISTGQTKFYRYMDQGGHELLKGNILKAKQLLTQALQILPEKLNNDDKAIFYNNLGVVYFQSGQYKESIDWYQKELSIYKVMNNDSLIAGSLHNLGLVYQEIGLYKNAMQELIQAARIFERLGNEKELSSAWNCLGTIQRELGNFKIALEYHHRALRIRKSINHEKGIADSYNNIGNVYLDWGHYDEAKKYLMKALEIKNGIENQSNIVNTLSMLGRMYVKTGKSQKAYSYLSEAYRIHTYTGNTPQVAENLLYLANYYANKKEVGKALELFYRVETIARESSDWILLSNALQDEIIQVESVIPYSKLVKKYRELLIVKEKASNETNNKELARLEIEYSVERKDKEIELRRKQANIDRLKNQRLWIWLVAVGGLALIVMIAFYNIRRRKKQVEFQKDKVTHLHHELSHRTKNYFGLLSGMLKFDRRKTNNIEVVQMLDANIHRLEAMALIQSYLLPDSKELNEKVQLDAYLYEIINELLLNLLPGDNTVQLKCDLDVIFLEYDKSMRMALVLNELICNAIKHALPYILNPELKVSLKYSSNQVVLTVRDNGSGVSEEQIRYFLTKGRSQVVKILEPVGGIIRYSGNDGCSAEVLVSC